MQLAIAAAVAIGLGLAKEVAAAPHCESVIQVGAWNIQWLGNATEGKRQEQTPHDLSAYIKAAAVDILALAEVSVTGEDSAGQARNKQLDEAFAQLNDGGGAWKYMLLPKREGARAPQDRWTGAAWNERKVQKVGGPWRLEASIDPQRESAIKKKFERPEPDSIIWSRWPHAFKFSAGTGLTDFVVVPIHLKSNNGGPATAEARAYEVELLLDSLVGMAPILSDEDYIILGDLNMLSTKEAGAAALKARSLRDCNDRDHGTHLNFKAGARDAPFDRVFLRPNRPESASSCLPSGNGSSALDFKVVRPTDLREGMTRSDFRKRLSDHLLVRVGLCVLRDDD